MHLKDEPEVVRALALDLRHRLEELKKRAYGRTHGDKKLRPQPGLPASREQLDGYERHLGFALPADYRAFLRLHRGFGNIHELVDFLDPLALMKPGSLAKRAQQFIEARQLTGHAAVIGRLRGPRTFVYFVCWSPARVEYVEQLPGKLTSRHAGLLALLDSYLGVDADRPAIPLGG